MSLPTASRRPPKPISPARSRSTTRTSTSGLRSRTTTSPRSTPLTLTCKMARSVSDGWAITGPVRPSSTRSRMRPRSARRRGGVRNDRSWRTGWRGDVDALGQGLLSDLDLDGDGSGSEAILPLDRHLVDPSVACEDVPGVLGPLPDRRPRRVQAVQPDVQRDRVLVTRVAQLERHAPGLEHRGAEAQIGAG